MTDALHTVDVRAHQRSLLRFALKFDAVASGMMGLLLLAGGSVLADLLGMPAGLLVPLGLFLAAYAVSIWLIGTPRSISRPAAWVVVGLNLVWVIESVAVVVLGWFPLTALGVAFVLAQAVAVLVFADLQYLGLRRSRPAIG